MFDLPDLQRSMLQELCQQERIGDDPQGHCSWLCWQSKIAIGHIKPYASNKQGWRYVPTA